MATQNLKRTPLYNRHVALGGKIVGFAGWELPVQYSGVIPEHIATRTAAGLFDVSHMGEIEVTGPESLQAIQYLTCNDVSKLVDGKAQYNAILNPQGGVVDDIIVYRFSDQHYFICVNASNTDKDFDWFTKHNQFKAQFINRSSEFGQIALQGPKALEILESITGHEITTIKPFHFLQHVIRGVPSITARTGYTGEDGVELFLPAESTVKIWDLLLESGKVKGLVPCGLGARDSLRLEACYPLHGHELGDEISALESGLGWIVKFDKGDFIGREALFKEKSDGLKRELVGILIHDAGIARQNDPIFDVNSGGGQIGVMTSGTKTPTVNRALGMALLSSKRTKVGTEVFVEVRGKRLKAVVAQKPFYKR